jgi:hypothetical protein
MAHSGQIDPVDIDQCPKFSQFTPLDTDKREVRLIRLGDDVKIETHPLLKAPPYHAISYCWGPPKPSRNISVQGEHVGIRQTVADLFTVLLEQHEPEARFWIDILSIDQRNLSERNSQVSMMSEIFSRAVEVISWLGQSTPQSRTVVRLVKKTLLCPENAPRRLLSDEKQMYNFDAADTEWPSTKQLEDDHDLYRYFAEIVVWPALADFMRRPYWNRLWVMQEIIVAENCTLLCGNDHMSLEDFASVSAVWIRKGQQFKKGKAEGTFDAIRGSSYQDVVDTWQPIYKISASYRDQYRKGTILLMEVVDSFVKKECTNVRDKVFALRSLSKEAATIDVDYSKTVLEVFLSLVQSGLLMSDGGRGFQSLPGLIRYMGIDHDTLNEQLSELPRSTIHLKGKLLGTIVRAAELESDPDTSRSGIGYLRVQDQNQWKEHYQSWGAQAARGFLHAARNGDVLFTIQPQWSLLVLLRLHENLELGTTNHAIQTMHDWGNKWSPTAQLSSNASLVGKIMITRDTSANYDQLQDIQVESHSLRGLTLQKNTVDTIYVLS